MCWQNLELSVLRGQGLEVKLFKTKHLAGMAWVGSPRRRRALLCLTANRGARSDVTRGAGKAVDFWNFL